MSGVTCFSGQAYKSTSRFSSDSRALGGPTAGPGIRIEAVSKSKQAPALGVIRITPHGCGRQQVRVKELLAFASACVRFGPLRVGGGGFGP